VLIYCVAEKADRGGVQNAVMALAAGLKSHGHEVVTAWPDGEESEGEAALPLCVDISLNPLVLIRTAIEGVRGLASLAGLLRRFRPDVVNIHFPGSQALYFLPLRVFYGYRLVLSFHGSDAHFAAGAVRQSLRLTMRRSDRITAVSAAAKRALTAMAPDCEDKIEIIHNGIDYGFWSDGEERERDPYQLVAAGRLVPVKGFGVLLEALARCRLQGLPVRLTLFGDGPEEATLRSLCEELRISDAVTFAGRVDAETLRSVYAQAGVFVLSSFSEGMPLALLEAMAAGLVPVCTAVGGVGEVMTPETGTMVPPDDAEALADAIAAVVQRLEGDDSVSSAAKARASQFSLQAQNARFSELVGGL
jgi:glycosyltransferase involved in cell wall biosynthesis